MIQYKQKFSGYQELHVHTTGSYRDAVVSVGEVFDYAEKLGRNAVAITDHGNMVRLFTALKERTKREKKVLEAELKNAGVEENEISAILGCIGAFDSIKAPSENIIPYIKKYPKCFDSACKKAVQFVAGIEGYIGDEVNQRMHIILYAKDWLGVKTLFKLNNRSQLTKSNGFPQMSIPLLKEYVSEGKVGHNHLICTSACMQGHIAQILLKPQTIEAKIAKLKSKIPNTKAFDSLNELEKMLETSEKDLITCKEARAAAKKASGKDLSARIVKLQDKINGLKDKMQYVEVGSLKETFLMEEISDNENKLNSSIAEDAQNKRLAASYDNIESDYNMISTKVKNIKEEIKNAKKVVEPILKTQAEIQMLEQQLNAIGDTFEEAKKVALVYDEIFGHGNFYIELQNHGIDEELYLLPLLKKLSSETNIPLTVANDVHYADKEDKRKRDIVASTRFNTPIEEIANKKGNDQLYFKSNEEMSRLFADVPQAIENTSRIAEQCQVYYKKEMHLPTFDTKSELTPIEYLEDFARKNIPYKYPNFENMSSKWKAEFEKRLTYELGIIEKMGYASYIAIVQDFITYAKSIDGSEKVGLGRGSAAGSLVCYLCNITGIDPLRYGLLFERFLNPDRVSMPDIDTDFAPSIRQKVIEYVDKRYEYTQPYDNALKSTICNIYTESMLGGRSAIRSVARVTGVDYNTADKIAKLIPAEPNMTVKKALKENEDFKKVYESDATAKKLLDDVLLVEGLPDHTGIHAAGVIIADKPVSEYAPMFWSEKANAWVVQCDMVACEKDLGLLKMDFLALKNLDIIATATNLARLQGLFINMEYIASKADDTKVIADIYGKGNTNGVFQFESSGMKQTLTSFKPSTIDDIVLLNAAYRPGPMQYIGEITDVKFGRTQPQYIVPEMKEILSETYSKPIYQEQIQQIFHKIAGFSLGEADIIRRAMSKKHIDELEQYKGKFVEGFAKRGVQNDKINAFWTELLDFASYAFNKSHAAAYSVLSYQTAYLKEYHLPEYTCSLFMYTPQEKLPLYIRNAKEMGVTTYTPDINKSELTFTLDGNNILFGLGNVKGVKGGAEAVIEERKAHGTFKSFKDLIMRACISGIKKSVIQNLILAGALDSLCKNRKAYYEITDEWVESCKKALKKVEKQTDGTYANIYSLLDSTWIAPIISASSYFTKQEALEKEKEFLGFYASGHPLDDMSEILKANSDIAISEIDENCEKVTLCGRIQNLQLLRRKSDGKQMCKFTLEDLSGEVDCICFTKEFAQFQGYISENAVVSLTGYVDAETDTNDEGETFIVNLQVRVISVRSTANAKTLMIKASLLDWTDTIYPAISNFPRGTVQIILNDTLCNEVKRTSVCVRAEDIEKYLNGQFDYAYCK